MRSYFAPMRPLLLGNQEIGDDGRLRLCGQSAVELASRFGTPLYVFDADVARETMRRWMSAAAQAAPESEVAFAAKANSALAVLALARSEGLAVDVASLGELEAARRAGFPPERIHLHGNYKTREELVAAVTLSLDSIVLDSISEIEALIEVCSEQKATARVMIRLAPGVDPETHVAISTGQEDTKFGFNISNGAARAAVERVGSASCLEFVGYHCHVGSQLFDAEAQIAGAERLAAFALECEGLVGLPRTLNAGGGLASRYTQGDQPVGIETYCSQVAEAALAPFLRAGKPTPKIAFEPGRSLVAEAGVTLYRAGPIKSVPIDEMGRTRRYLSVDGGLSDNPRPQLYDAVYTAVNATRGAEPHSAEFRIAGRHCETDTLIASALLPEATQEGDLIAVLSTGAYNYSMASNYNRFPRPAMVMLSAGRAEIVVERETISELFTRERVFEFTAGAK